MSKTPAFRTLSWFGRVAALEAAAFLVVLANAARAEVHAQGARNAALESVVQITAHVPHDARTASSLGTKRHGLDLSPIPLGESAEAQPM